MRRSGFVTLLLIETGRHSLAARATYPRRSWCSRPVCSLTSGSSFGRVTPKSAMWACTCWSTSSRPRD